jgi:ribosomal protein S18 acetylase RimI-like enzyme
MDGIDIRRLGPADGDVIERLAEGEPRTALLDDPDTIFLVAFDGDVPVGFAFGYELDRRHGDERMLFVYELDVDEAYRRQGIATRLMQELLRLAEVDGITDAFVLTEPDNVAANGVYEKVGGRATQAVMWEYRS